jgi:uncharacterized protein (TIGR03437 family)
MIMRWGGEEFLIVLPNTGGAEALSNAERLRAAVAATEVAFEGASICFTISVGVAVPAGESPSELLSRSDAALYTAKTGGRNKVTINNITVLPAFAGITSAGLYQINIVGVPSGLGVGDVPLLATVDGIHTQSGVLLSLK